MGMSEKQINKMTILEGIFYGLDAIIYGVIISITILYVVYLLLINTKLYPFEVSYTDIAITIGVVYLTIFIAMTNARRKLKKQNIVEEIREENI